MTRVKVNLVTLSDIKEFVTIADTIQQEVCLEDDEGHKVSAKSLLGCMYSVEFKDTYVTSENPFLSTKFAKFVC